MQAEPASFETTRGRRIDLTERLKQFCLMLGQDPANRVGYAHLGEAAALAAIAPERDADLAVVRAFDRIVDEIDDDLTQGAAICLQDDIFVRLQHFEDESLLLGGIAQRG